MKTICRNIFLTATLIFIGNVAVSQSKFKVTLDAGHGDHDPGARYNGHIEKEINLALVLKIGKLLEQQPDVQVIYTRKTDQFIDLVERANIANRAKSDIFVSIHCNANDREGAYGTETFVMGLTKNSSNLAAAKKENAVITLEKNYKQKYHGYDPNKPESLIGMTLMQEEFLNNSISLAGKIESNFKNMLGLKSRGVEQAPFMVLHKAYMPRVLVETGFISNINEGNRLDSEAGQNDVAEAVAKAILSYKDDFFDPENTTIEPTPVVKDPTPVQNNNAGNTTNQSSSSTPGIKQGVLYKVQLCASAKKMELKPYNFKGLENLSVEKDGNIYKYFYGEENSYTSIEKMWKEAKSKGYKTSFITATKNGKNITVKEARKLQ